MKQTEADSSLMVIHRRTRCKKQRYPTGREFFPGHEESRKWTDLKGQELKIQTSTSTACQCSAKAFFTRARESLSRSCGHEVLKTFSPYLRKGVLMVLDCSLKNRHGWSFGLCWEPRGRLWTGYTLLAGANATLRNLTENWRGLRRCIVLIAFVVFRWAVDKSETVKPCKQSQTHGISPGSQLIELIINSTEKVLEIFSSMH